LFERPAYSVIGIEKLVSDEVELAFNGFMILPVGAAQGFRLLIWYASRQPKLIQQTFGLFFGPALVEKNHLTW
jgi:hypothetical protein